MTRVPRSGAALLRAAPFAVLFAAPLHAQPPARTPRVVVVDAESGRPVDGAEVTLLAAGSPTPLGTTRSGADGTAGLTRATSLAPGAYRMRVRRLGYAAYESAVAIDASAVPVRVSLVPAVVSLDATVVSASRRIQRLADAPVAVQLVTRDEITRSGASDLATVLTERAGLATDGGTPSGAGVMLQGLDSRRVLVLLDGQPLVGRLNGNFDLSRIPSSIIERVEVVKGPQSTLYGSDALGGVVNVITRDAPEAFAGGASITGGSQGRRDVAANAGGALGGVRWLADAGHRSVESTPGRDGSLDARSERWDGAGKLHWGGGTDSSASAELSALLLDEQQRWRAGQIFTFGDNRQASLRATGAWTHGATHLQPIVSFSTYDHLSRQALSASPTSPDGERDLQRLLSAELLGSHRFGASGDDALGTARAPLVLDGGVAARREEARSDRVPDGLRERTWVEPYAQLTVGGERWSIVPGARMTQDSRWGTFVTPRVAAMLRPAGASSPLAFRLSAGRGYRAPDFKELYLALLHDQYGYVVQGNPDLRPEIDDNASGSAEWAGARLYLRADLFANRFRNFIEDQIVGDVGGVTAYSYGNIGRGITRGVDVDGVLRLGPVRTEAGYDFLDAYERDTKAPLLGRSRHAARLSFGLASARGLSATLGGVYTGTAPVVRLADGTVEQRDAFVRVNARVAQSLARAGTGEWRLELGADNLLGARPNLWPGFTGRRVYTGLAWQSGTLR